MSVVVRRATRADAAQIASLASALFEQHVGYDPVRFSRVGTPEGMAWFYGGQTEEKDSAVMIAELDGRCVGFAYIGYEPINYAALLKKAVWLHDIYVEPEARGSGAGKELIAAAVVEAAAMGTEKLMLSVAAANEVGQRFFESAGFRTTMLEMMLPLAG